MKEKRSKQPCPKTGNGKHSWKNFGMDPTNLIKRCFACGVVDGE